MNNTGISNRGVPGFDGPSYAGGSSVTTQNSNQSAADSSKFNWNNLVSTVGNVASSVFGNQNNNQNMYAQPGGTTGNPANTVLIIVGVLIAGVLIYKIAKK